MRTSAGRSRSTPPSCEPTSMRPGPAKGGPGQRTRRPCHRTAPRWADDQDPPGCRCPLPASRFRSHRRTGRRCTGLRRRHGPPACAPATWPAAYQTGRGPGGQSLFIPCDPRPPAPTRHPCRDPCPGGSAWPPTATRPPGRQTAGLRPRDLQAAQHRRAVHQPPQTVARHRHPLREDSHHLPGRTPHRWHLPLVRR